MSGKNTRHILRSEACDGDFPPVVTKDVCISETSSHTPLLIIFYDVFMTFFKLDMNEWTTVADCTIKER